jgi:hypothetical protein
MPSKAVELLAMPKSLLTPAIQELLLTGIVKSTLTNMIKPVNRSPATHDKSN